MLEMLGNDLTAQGRQSLADILTVKESYLAAALSAIQQRYGNVDAWLAEEYQLTAPARVALQARLLEKKQQCVPVILLDVPLLFEAGWDKMAEGACLVYADEPVQLARLMARNGYDRPEALARIHAQMSLDEKKRRAKWIIDNNGSLPEALAQADQLWKEWTHEGLS